MKRLIRRGDLFEDCQRHPVLCLEVIPDWSGCTWLQRLRGDAWNWVLKGRSLRDGTGRQCTLKYCDPAPRRISAAEAGALGARRESPAALDAGDPGSG